MHRIALKRACVLFPDVRSERPEGESCRVLSVGLGLTLALRPGAGALALVWFIGAYSISFGLHLLMLAIWLRSWARRFSALEP
ncbi:DUF308 domain-containing protein [Singulisphaera sp. PoT]|uniref:DUF308 domain-containing protein n=1 Tax=Singulisphaera sp. PoT TaxID=3411797 RepID=UPI003BF57CF9